MGVLKTIAIPQGKEVAWGTGKQGDDHPDDGREETDRPGREIDSDHRTVIEYLIDNEGWAYKLPKGGGYPRLYPADRNRRAISVPKTGHRRGRAFNNWIAQVRQKGGHWPPERK